MDCGSVTFLPDQITVKAATGKSLLEAARAAGVAVNSVCGGDGVCGKCRVTIRSGKVTADPNIYLTRDEIQRGVALACQTYVDGDVVVEIPPESRVGAVPHLASEDAVRFGCVREWVGEGAPFPHEPLARKEYVELPPPTIEDHTSDQERLFAALGERWPTPAMQMGLAVLHSLPALLRQHDWRVTALMGKRGGTVEVVDVLPGDQSACNYGVAVDIGTTTIVAHLVDLRTSETRITKAKYNSQVRFGDDVIARIMYASSGERTRELQQCLIGDINELIAGMVVDAGVRQHDVSYVMCAGNTTMTHFLYGLDPGNIRREPYIPCAAQPPVVRAAEVGVKIHPRGLLGAVPSPACYVGGDVVADVLVTGMTSSESLSLVLDLGTNGEVVLGNSEWLMCCSASAGPAFEGGGITSGMRATHGAIESLDLGPGGAVSACDVVGGGRPLGICGSGIIDAVGELLRVGCIDRRGRFVDSVCGSRLREGESGDREFVLVPACETALGRDIVITEADINNFIHTKGSIYMAAETLLSHVNLGFTDLEHVYIAGGFGNHLHVGKAIRLGLLPDLPREVFKFVGNGSVQGAKMALLSGTALSYMGDRIAGAMTYLDLSTNHKYMNGYSSCLFLPHTDVERFPSIRAGNAVGEGGRA